MHNDVDLLNDTCATRSYEAADPSWVHPLFSPFPETQVCNCSFFDIPAEVQVHTERRYYCRTGYKLESYIESVILYEHKCLKCLYGKVVHILRLSFVVCVF